MKNVVRAALVSGVIAAAGTYVIATPELMTAAVTDLATIGSDLSVAHAAAAPATIGVVAAAQDEMSSAIAALFSEHGRGFQALGAQVSVFHEQLTRPNG